MYIDLNMESIFKFENNDIHYLQYLLLTGRQIANRFPTASHHQLSLARARKMEFPKMYFLTNTNIVNKKISENSSIYTLISSLAVSKPKFISIFTVGKIKFRSLHFGVKVTFFDMPP